MKLFAKADGELMLLPGIGNAISARVIAWGERNGAFPRLVDIRRVRGIGPETFVNRPGFPGGSLT